ncbi:unnamed protein product [Cochlearia groenlandica]
MVSTSSTTHASGSQATFVDNNTPQDRQREWIERFNKIKWKKVHPTRFMDTNVLIKQGIRKQVKDLLDIMDTKALFTLDEPTYPELTLQFLATVDYEDNETTRRVTFMLEGEPYSINFEMYCELYGLRRGRRMKRGAASCPIQLLWENIAIMEDFRQSRERMSKYDELPNAYMDEEYMVMAKTSAGCFNEDAFMYTLPPPYLVLRRGSTTEEQIPYHW